MLLTLMIEPPRPAAMRRWETSRESRKGPSRLTARVRCQSSGVVRKKGMPWEMPALALATLRSPDASYARPAVEEAAGRTPS